MVRNRSYQGLLLGQIV